MIRRDIAGPQAKFERSGADGLRDVRPLTTRLSEALRSSVSAPILVGMAGLTWFVPGALNVTLPLSALYAGWVLTRRVILPLRLPRSAARLDWNYPDPATRKPRPAAGSIYLGRDALTGQELWITNEDGRQHATIPGTTGAGKTTAILSMLANSLAHGSGFVLVDGKADNKLYGEVVALARRFGREDDVLALNFLVASGVKESSTFNPLAFGNADALRELLVSQLGETSKDDTNGVFRARAVALLGTLAPALIWMRDNKGVPIDIETVRRATELPWIWTLAKSRKFRIFNRGTGEAREIDVPDMPEHLIYPLLAYLGELPGYDQSVPLDKQRSDKPSEQHGYAVMYFTGVFQQLGGSLGHIFKVENGDIDMRDVVLNRRILVVNLPALENSEDTQAALGRIVVASLRAMMAQMLGARLEGEAGEIFALKPGTGDGPFMVVFDELAYYASGGMDRMLAMGRGLNIMFWLAFQEVSGVWARLGEKTNSLLGNANLTVAMRQQEASRTREWLEKTAGSTFVTQATSYHGGSVGQYREAQHAEVKQVSRIDWNDLQRLIEGEAIILLAGRRVYAKVFHAQVNTSGPVRLNRPIPLPQPSRLALQGEHDRIERLVETLRSKSALAGIEEEGPILAALLDGFGAALKDGTPPLQAARVAFGRAAGARTGGVASGEIKREGGAGAEPPVTDLLVMLEAIHAEPPAANDPGVPASPVNADLMRAFMAIETMATGNQHLARRNSLAALAARDRALEDNLTVLKPAEVSPAGLVMLIDRVCQRLAS